MQSGFGWADAQSNRRRRRGLRSQGDSSQNQSTQSDPTQNQQRKQKKPSPSENKPVQQNVKSDRPAVVKAKPNRASDDPSEPNPDVKRWWHWPVDDENQFDIDDDDFGSNADADPTPEQADTPQVDATEPAQTEPAVSEERNPNQKMDDSRSSANTANEATPIDRSDNKTSSPKDDAATDKTTTSPGDSDTQNRRAPDAGASDSTPANNKQGNKEKGGMWNLFGMVSDNDDDDAIDDSAPDADAADNREPGANNDQPGPANLPDADADVPQSAQASDRTDPSASKSQAPPVADGTNRRPRGRRNQRRWQPWNSNSPEPEPSEPSPTEGDTQPSPVQDDDPAAQSDNINDQNPVSETADLPKQTRKRGERQGPSDKDPAKPNQDADGSGWRNWWDRKSSEASAENDPSDDNPAPDDGAAPDTNQVGPAVPPDEDGVVPDAPDPSNDDADSNPAQSKASPPSVAANRRPRRRRNERQWTPWTSDSQDPNRSERSPSNDDPQPAATPPEASAPPAGSDRGTSQTDDQRQRSVSEKTPEQQDDGGDYQSSSAKQNPDESGWRNWWNRKSRDPSAEGDSSIDDTSPVKKTGADSNDTQAGPAVPPDEDGVVPDAAPTPDPTNANADSDPSQSKASPPSAGINRRPMRRNQRGWTPWTSKSQDPEPSGQSPVKDDSQALAMPSSQDTDPMAESVPPSKDMPRTKRERRPEELRNNEDKSPDPSAVADNPAKANPDQDTAKPDVDGPFQDNGERKPRYPRSRQFDDEPDTAELKTVDNTRKANNAPRFGTIAPASGSAAPRSVQDPTLNGDAAKPSSPNAVSADKSTSSGPPSSSNARQPVRNPWDPESKSSPGPDPSSAKSNPPNSSIADKPAPARDLQEPKSLRSSETNPPSSETDSRPSLKPTSLEESSADNSDLAKDQGADPAKGQPPLNDQETATPSTDDSVQPDQNSNDSSWWNPNSWWNSKSPDSAPDSDQADPIQREDRPGAPASPPSAQDDVKTPPLSKRPSNTQTDKRKQTPDDPRRKSSANPGSPKQMSATGPQPSPTAAPPIRNPSSQTSEQSSSLPESKRPAAGTNPSEEARKNQRPSGASSEEKPQGASWWNGNSPANEVNQETPERDQNERRPVQLAQDVPAESRKTSKLDDNIRRGSKDVQKPEEGHLDEKSSTKKASIPAHSRPSLNPAKPDPRMPDGANPERQGSVKGSSNGDAPEDASNPSSKEDRPENQPQLAGSRSFSKPRAEEPPMNESNVKASEDSSDAAPAQEPGQDTFQSRDPEQSPSPPPSNPSRVNSVASAKSTVERTDSLTIVADRPQSVHSSSLTQRTVPDPIGQNDSKPIQSDQDDGHPLGADKPSSAVPNSRPSQVTPSNGIRTERELVSGYLVQGVRSRAFNRMQRNAHPSRETLRQAKAGSRACPAGGLHELEPCHTSGKAFTFAVVTFPLKWIIKNPFRRCMKCTTIVKEAENADNF